MKKILLLMISFCAFYTCFAQKEKAAFERRADSARAARSIKDLSAFQLSEGDKVKLAAAAARANEIRRESFKQYWKTPVFQKEFDKGQHYEDSVYISILGKDKFLQYKAKQVEQRDRFEMAQKLRQQRQKDSIPHPVKTKKDAQ